MYRVSHQEMMTNLRSAVVTVQFLRLENAWYALRSSVLSVFTYNGS